MCTMCTSPISVIFLKHNPSQGDRNKAEVMKRKNKEHSQIRDGWIDVLKLNKSWHTIWNHNDIWTSLQHTETSVLEEKRTFFCFFLNGQNKTFSFSCMQQQNKQTRTFQSKRLEWFHQWNTHCLKCTVTGTVRKFALCFKNQKNTSQTEHSLMLQYNQRVENLPVPHSSDIQFNLVNANEQNRQIKSTGI